MSTPRNEKIFFLRDTNEYIYQWQAVYFDGDDYDHHSYHILHFHRKEPPGIIKPIQL